MNISLSDSLKSFVDEQVSQGGYSTSSEYVRELIRKEAERVQLRALLLEGATSAPTAPVDAVYFSGLRERGSRTTADWLIFLLAFEYRQPLRDPLRHPWTVIQRQIMSRIRMNHTRRIPRRRQL